MQVAAVAAVPAGMRGPLRSRGTLASGLGQKPPRSHLPALTAPWQGCAGHAALGRGGQLRKCRGGMQVWSRGGAPRLWCWVLWAQREAAGVEWVLGLVAAWGWGELPSCWPRPGRGAKPGALARGGQRAFAQGCGSCVLPAWHRGIFLLGRRHFWGRWCWGPLAESLWLLGSVPQFPLWSRLSPPLPATSWLPGGCCGSDTVQGAVWGHGGNPVSGQGLGDA